MEKAKRARKAETPKQPSLHLRISAPQFYPDKSAFHLTVSSDAVEVRLTPVGWSGGINPHSYILLQAHPHV